MNKLFLASLILAAEIGIVGAQTNLTILVNFSGTNGAQPACDLFQGSDGNLYGTTEQGGNLTLNSGLGYGSIFKVTLDGQFSTLAAFNFTNGDSPYGGVIQGHDGNFYGTTQLGGTNGNLGTLFRISTNSVLTNLVYFNVTNGDLPYDQLLLGTDGRLYGTTASGVPGTNDGTIFAYDTNLSTLTTIAALNNSDGTTPWAGLLQGTNGLMYGTTTSGGFGYGTVFTVTTNGAVNPLITFQPPSPFPEYPYGCLAYGSDGFIYGTANGGGSNSEGVVFKITGTGVTNVVTFNGTNGAYPSGKLCLASNSYMYGMTSQGGPQSDGTIFKISPAGALTTLVVFTNGNGHSPEAGLIQASDGNLYGVTRLGGKYNLGTLFRLSASPAPFLSFAKLGTNFVVQWTNAADYTLQFTSNAANPIWTTAMPLPTQTNNTSVYSNHISGTAGFYRLISTN